MLTDTLSTGAVRRFAKENGIALVCIVLLAAYLSLSEALRYHLAAWPYHFWLLQSWIAALGKEVTPTLPGTVDIPSSSGEPLLLALFVLSCGVSAGLIKKLTRSSVRAGPTYILLFLGTAIIPTLLMACWWWPDGQGKLNSETVILVGGIINAALLTAWFLLRPGKDAARTEDTAMRRQPLGAKIYLISALVILILVFLAGYGVIHGYDSMSYHLPMGAAWWKESRLSTGTNVQLYYPGNMELLLRWALTTGSDRYSFVVSYLAALASLYVLYEICFALGMTRTSAVFTACCAISSMLLPYLATTSYNDTVSTLFLLLAVFFLIEYVRSEFQNTFAVACVGLALGLAAGTKYSVLPSALIIALAMAFLIFRDCMELQPSPEYDEPSQVRVNRGRLVRNVLVFLVPCLGGGLFWYLRNFLEQGNPFYPIGLMGLPGMLPKTLFGVGVAGLEEPDWRWAAYPWVEFGHKNIFDEGVGAMFGAVVIPSLLIWWRGRRSEIPSLSLVYFVTLGSFAAFFLSGQFRPRFALFPIMLSFIFLGVLIEQNRSALLRWVIAAAYSVAMIVLGESLIGGILYHQLIPQRQGAARFGIPAEVDTLAPTTIFNATAASNTYGLMGADYRHQVISLYRGAEPTDLHSYPARYILLRESQVPLFAGAVNLTRISRESTSSPESLSLWRIIEPRSAAHD